MAHSLVFVYARHSIGRGKRGCIHTERCLPASLPLPQNPGCFAEIASAVSPHVRVSLLILSGLPTTREFCAP